ncbi:MAG: DEAD/DEAH box helicase family protein, partial [Chloroflexi bacterium]|nr:DEAD/DEAH box helicase family protein [Chloroflexota bacterium]
MPPFRLVAPFQPTGDQPEAIAKLAAGIERGYREQVLLGVTGSGKTYTMACVVERVQRPTLVLAHNKTLAAQLWAEFKEFFPDNAVEYFRDVLIVASVSCIYSLGSPQDYQQTVVHLRRGAVRKRDRVLRFLTDIQYERNDYQLARGKFRVRGDTLEIQPAYEETALRVEFWDDEVERIVVFDPLTGEVLGTRDEVLVYPAKHFITTEEKLALALADIEGELAERAPWFEEQGKLLEAQRIKQRTAFDMEMLRETGVCPGVENYSRHLQRREPGSRPWTLLDYFPDDFLLFIDESHITLPQVRGMYEGDRARKQVLVDYGFRLPSAMDNRPLRADEFFAHIHQVVYVSATPAEFERSRAQEIAEQLIRPTGVLDPTIAVKPTRGQIDDLLAEIRTRVAR